MFKHRTPPPLLLSFLLSGGPCHPGLPPSAYGHPISHASAAPSPTLTFKLYEDLSVVHLLGNFGLVPEEIRVLSDGVPLDFTLGGSCHLQVRLPDWQRGSFHFTLQRVGHPPQSIDGQGCQIVDTVEELLRPHSESPEDQEIDQLLREAFPFVSLPPLALKPSEARPWNGSTSLEFPSPARSQPSFTPPRSVQRRTELAHPGQASATPWSSATSPWPPPESPWHSRPHSELSPDLLRLRTPETRPLSQSNGISPSRLTFPRIDALSAVPGFSNLFALRGEHLAEWPACILVEPEDGPRSYGWVALHKDDEITFFLKDPTVSHVRVLLGSLDQIWGLPPSVPETSVSGSASLAGPPHGSDHPQDSNDSHDSQLTRLPVPPPAPPKAPAPDQPLGAKTQPGRSGRKRPRSSPPADDPSQAENSRNPRRRQNLATQPQGKKREIGPQRELPPPSCPWAADLFKSLDRSADMHEIVNVLARAQGNWVPATSLKKIFLKRRNGTARNAAQRHKALLGRIREINYFFLRDGRGERIEPQDGSFQAIRLLKPEGEEAPGQLFLTPSDPEEGDLMFGPLLLRPSTRSAGILNRTPLMKVTLFRWKVLETLLKARGEAVSPAQLGLAVYGTSSFEPEALRNLVSTVRRALGLQPNDDLLVVLPGNAGYRLQLPDPPASESSPASGE